MNNVIEIWDKNFKALMECDKKAKKEGVLVGRYIKEQVCDGYAFYKVVKESKKKVTISKVSGIGDDWCINYWGNEAQIDKKYAIQNITQRDNLEKLFSKKGAI